NAAGQVWDAGYNRFCQLGGLDNADRPVWDSPHNPANHEIIGIACGFGHSMFLDLYGRLYVSGYNLYGQLGDGTTVNRTVPTGTNTGYVISMAGGYGHTLILTRPRVEVASVTVSPTSVKGGTTVIGTVTLTGVAGAGGQRVSL